MLPACAVLLVGGCRRQAPERSVVVVVPPGLEASLRAATLPLGRAGAPVNVELRVAALDARALEGADVVVAHSAAGLSVVAPSLAGERVAFGCDDEVVLIAPDGEPATTLRDAVGHASSIALADPRGDGEAAEAAIARAGLRVKAAPKLRYVPTAADVIDAVARDGGVGLLLRSDLTRAQPRPVAVVAAGFDGARGCPTAARLATAPHPLAAARVLALLTSTSTAGASASATKKD